MHVKNLIIIFWENPQKLKQIKNPLEIIFKKSLLCAPKRLQRMLLLLQKYLLIAVDRAGLHLHLAHFLFRAALTDTEHKCDTADSNFTVFDVNKLFHIFLLTLKTVI